MDLCSSSIVTSRQSFKEKPVQVSWAEAHPEAVASIVRNANVFAEQFLTPMGKSCYATMMLHEYAQMQCDPWSIQEQFNGMVRAEDL